MPKSMVRFHPSPLMEIQVDTITKEDVLTINSLVERGILRKIDIGGWEMELNYEPFGTTYSDEMTVSDAWRKGNTFVCVIPKDDNQVAFDGDATSVDENLQANATPQVLKY